MSQGSGILDEYTKNVLAHVGVVVSKTRSLAVAIRAPQYAGFIDDEPENHWGRNRSENSYHDPLNAQSKRSLLVLNASQGRRQSRHRCQEGENHDKKRQNDKIPKVSALSFAGEILRFETHPATISLGGEIERRIAEHIGHELGVRRFFNARTFGVSLR